MFSTDRRELFKGLISVLDNFRYHILNQQFPVVLCSPIKYIYFFSITKRFLLSFWLQHILLTKQLNAALLKETI